MNATIIGYDNIKSFFECLTSIRKVSDDIIFCATRTFLSIQALNSSQTSLPVLCFYESFFGEYKYFSEKESVSFQMLGQRIKYVKRIYRPSLLTITFDHSNPKVFIELIDNFNIIHKFEFFTSEASVLEAVQSNDILLTAKVQIKELSIMQTAFKCPYIIINCIKNEEGSPYLFFESFNSTDREKKSFYTINNSKFCSIKTDNECRIILSFADFMQILKIAKPTSEYVEINAGPPGTAFTIQSHNHNKTIKFVSSLATLADDDIIASANSSQASIIQSSAIVKAKSANDSDDNFISQPASPVRGKLTNSETSLNETGRLSSSNNSQCSTSTQVVPWKTEFSASPEFPSKRKYSDVVVDKSQPTDEDYSEDDEKPTGSFQKFF